MSVHGTAAITHPPLVISGIPGAGKSYFVRWLAGKGFVTVFNDHPGTGPMEEAWRGRYERGGLAQVAGVAMGLDAPVAIEYGFYPPQWREIDQLVDAGCSAWWFDGDRRAAKAAWRSAWRGAMQDTAWENQIRAIDAESQNLRRVYGAHRIVTVFRTEDDGYRHLTPAAIWDVVSAPSG